MGINWFIAICIGIVVIAFVILVIFVILALLSLRRMLQDLDEKIRSLDPMFRVVNQAGNFIEKKVERFKESSEETENELQAYKKGHVNTAMQLTELVLTSMAIWQKMRQKKGG